MPQPRAARAACACAASPICRPMPSPPSDLRASTAAGPRTLPISRPSLLCPAYSLRAIGAKVGSAARELAMPGRRHNRPPISYRDSGVDIDAGNALVEAIKPLAKSTRRPGADADLGGFGALFDLKAAGFKDPDPGRRQRRRRHQAQDRHRDRPARHASASTSSPCASTTCWRRAPSRCSSSTTSPAASSTWRPRARVVAGIAEGCRQAGCALIGGETAEMPGMYAGDDYDLAGFAVGAVERGAAAAARRHRGRRRADRPAVLGRALQRLLAGAPARGRGEARLGRAGALRAGAHRWPRRCWRRRASMCSRCCRRSARPAPSRAWRTSPAAGLSRTCRACCRPGWPRTSISAPGRRRPCSAGCAQAGASTTRRCCAPSTAASAWCSSSREPRPTRAGGASSGWRGTARDRRDRARPRRQIASQGQGRGRSVRYSGRLGVARDHCCPKRAPTLAPPQGGGKRAEARMAPMKKRVGILISGRGSNMMALVEAARAPDYPAEIAARHLQPAGGAGARLGAGRRASRRSAIDHKAYATREAFDDAVEAALDDAGVDLVCHAGFMRIQSDGFVARWRDASSTSTPRCCRPSRACTRTSRRSMRGCEFPAARCISSRRSWTAGPIVAQAAVPVRDRRHARHPGRTHPRGGAPALSLAPCAWWLRGLHTWRTAACTCRDSVNQAAIHCSRQSPRRLDKLRHTCWKKTPQQAARVDRPEMRVLPVDNNDEPEFINSPRR